MGGGVNKYVQVAVAVIVIVIVATVLAGSDILGQASLGSFTGFVPIARLIPLILVVGLLGAGGAVAYKKYYRRRR